MSALVFSSCFDTALLVAGINTDKNLDALDAQGVLARFSDIQDIAVDSLDNVYVSDTYSENQKTLGVAIRKIEPNGEVTTLKNSLFSAPGPSLPIPKERLFKDSNLFIQSTIMAIKSSVLYIAATDCIYSIDLKEPVENLIIKTYWGTCFPQTEQQLAEYNNDPKRFPDIVKFKSDMTITNDHTIYAVAESSTIGKVIFKLLPNQTQAEKSTFNGSLAQTFGFSHDHRVFIGYFDPPVGPPPMGDGKSYTEISGSKGYSKVDYFFDHMVFDSQNRMYTYKNSEIVRYDSNWKSKWIGRLHSYSPIKRMVLNPSETALYLASETAVYRLPLPKD